MEIGTCALCQKADSELQKSHILPKWSHSDIKKDGEKVNPISITTVDRDDTILPTTVETTKDDWEHILCKNCEQLLGREEDYLKVFLTQVSSGNRWKNLNLNIKQSHFTDMERSIFVITHVRESLLKAVLGILYKASFAQEELYHSVSLSEEQLNEISYNLLNSSNQPENPKIFILKLAVKNFNFYTVGAYSPTRLQYVLQLNENLFQVAIGGWTLTIQYTQKQNICGVYSPVEEELIVLPRFWSQKYAFNGINTAEENEKEYTWDKDLTSTYPDFDWCPCGNKMAYRDCCKFFWFNTQMDIEKDRIFPFENMPENALKIENKKFTIQAARIQSRVLTYGIDAQRAKIRIDMIRSLKEEGFTFWDEPSTDEVIFGYKHDTVENTTSIHALKIFVKGEVGETQPTILVMDNEAIIFVVEENIVSVILITPIIGSVPDKEIIANAYRYLNL